MEAAGFSETLVLICPKTRSLIAEDHDLKSTDDCVDNKQDRQSTHKVSEH
jgi:hypothetical protein